MKLFPKKLPKKGNTVKETACLVVVVRLSCEARVDERHISATTYKLGKDSSTDELPKKKKPAPPTDGAHHVASTSEQQKPLTLEADKIRKKKASRALVKPRRPSMFESECFQHFLTPNQKWHDFSP